MSARRARPSAAADRFRFWKAPRTVRHPHDSEDKAMSARIIIDAATPTTHARWRPRAIAALLLLASAMLHGNASAAICTATGTGNWNVPATWSGCGGGVPGAADTARINAVSGTTVVTITTGVVVTVARIEFGVTGSPTLTVDGSLTAGDVVHHGNTINGVGPITVTGTYDWLGSGLLQGFPLPDGSSPVVTFAPGSTWNLSGPARSLSRRAIVQQGNAHFSAASMVCSNAATWQIAASATVTFSAAGNITSHGVDCRIRNEGTIRKTGAGTFQFNDSRVRLENHGLFDVQDGVFDWLNGGGPTEHSGVFRTAAGARLNAPRSAASFAAGTTFEGPGEVHFSGGDSNFLGDVAFAGPVVMRGADLVAASGATLRFPAGLTWMSGRLRGPGSFVVPAGSTLVLTGSTPKIVGSFAQVRLEGSTLWHDGELAFQSSATPPQTRLVNAAGADFQVLFRPATMNMSGSDNNVFENLGTFTATTAADAGLFTIGNSLRGTVINSGTMVLAGEVSSQTRVWRQTAGQLLLDEVRMRLTGESFDRPLTLEGGVLTGNGVFDGAVLNTGAVILPGGVDAIGAIGVQGRYSETAGASMELDVAGSTPDEYDRLVVSGTPGRIDLRGDIEVNRLGGFQFGGTDALTLVDALTAPATSVPAGVGLDPSFAPVPEVRLDRSRVVLGIDQLFADDLEAPLPAATVPDDVFTSTLD
jgi:hypothetical protein